MPISQIRNFNLKVITLIHFVFISISLMGYWSSSAYLFYNAILISFLLWSCYQQHEDPVQMSIAVNGIAIVLDILVLCFRWPSSGSASEKFSVTVAVLHLLFRPLSVFGLSKILEERGGSSGIIGEVFGGGPSPSSYEDIDRTGIPTRPTPTTGGYDIATAHQI